MKLKDCHKSRWRSPWAWTRLQYSRIENSKTDPSFSNVTKIAKALGVELSELFKSDEVFKDVNSYDKSLIEKLSIIEKLDDKEKQAFYSILDALVAKKNEGYSFYCNWPGFVSLIVDNFLCSKYALKYCIFSVCN